MATGEFAESGRNWLGNVRSEYCVVLPVGDARIQGMKPDGAVCDVTFDGAQVYGPEDVDADRHRLNPRLGKKPTAAIIAASVAVWGADSSYPGGVGA